MSQNDVSADVFYATVESQLLSGKKDIEVSSGNYLHFRLKSGEVTLKADYAYDEGIISNLRELLFEFDFVRTIKLFILTNANITLDCKYGGCYINVPDSKALIQNELERVHDIMEESLNCGDIRTLFVSIDEGFDWDECGKILNGKFHTGLRDGKLSGMLIDRQTSPHSYKFWLWKGTPDECRIPPGCNMNVGATALLLDQENNKVCLVCPKHRSNYFNFPGGNLDFHKDNWLVETTAFREACEELGIEEVKLRSYIKSQMMVALMGFPGNTFGGAINVTICFIVDGLSKCQTQFEEREIESGIWVDIDQLLACGGVFDGKTVSRSIITSIEAAISGKGFNKIDAGVSFMNLWVPQ